MNRNKSYSVCSEILRTSKYNDYQISQILINLESKDGYYQAYAISTSNPDDMISIKVNYDQSYQIFPVAEWDFNIDEYLLEHLENGYEIDYMPLNEHYNTWCAIDEWRNELQHTDGLQKYLSYCQKNDINSNIIGIYSNNLINIMDMYKENNCGYDII